MFAQLTAVLVWLTFTTDSPDRQITVPPTETESFASEDDLWLEMFSEDVLVAVIHDAYDFSFDVVEDILWVAGTAGTSPFVLASLVDRESDGRRDVSSYCVKWAKPVQIAATGRWKKPCLQYRSCWRDCRTTKAIWKNHLDVGLWQLRDVVEKMPDKRFAGWSWLRWYSFDTKDFVGSDCALDRHCSRKVMARVITHLVDSASRTKRLKCRTVPIEWQWLGSWNGCKSAMNHTKRATALQRKFETSLQIGVLLYNLTHRVKQAVRWLDLPSISQVIRCPSLPLPFRSSQTRCSLTRLS